ncbi:MAG: QueT transporter family protein [Oscillospiraceae bacterium]|nr:QueT transporter family protein [Oscillospiraceae bacterium]
MKNSNKIRKIAFAGVIGALYAALTMSLGFISYGPIQFRIAEAMTILPFFFPFSILGLFVGCIIANLMSPYPLDIVVGPIASLIAGVCTIQISKLGRDKVWVKVWGCFPPVIVNAVLIGAMIAFYMVGFSDLRVFLTAMVVSGLQVGFGQLVILYAIGLPVMIYLPKSNVYGRLSEYVG